MLPKLTALTFTLFLGGIAFADVSVRLEKVVEGLVRPTHLCGPPGDPTRLFICLDEGHVRVVENGVLLATPFLDIESIVHQGEGLAAMACHPNYAQNGFVYLSFLDRNQNSRLVRYTTSATDANVADPNSAVDILPPTPQPSVLHNWNEVCFGLDGRLYLATGDGLVPNDNSANHAQDLSQLFGKILRLDLNIPYPHIPPDNPFVGVPGAREEIWALGFRNPWRIAFDPFTGALWVGDVGKAKREELNRIPGGQGAGWNFGWRCIEGDLCTNFSGCLPCSDPGFTPPTLHYPHVDSMCAVVGGRVYRGWNMPTLQGRYYFGDYCTGRVWSLRHDGTSITNMREESASLVSADGSRLDYLVSFGEDAAGELYLIDLDGQVFRLASDCGQISHYCTSNPNSSGSAARIGAAGSLDPAANDLHLSGFDLPPGQFGYFLFSATTGFTPGFGGSQGNLCLSAPLVRFSKDILSVDTAGRVLFQPDLANLPQNSVFKPGSTWHFELWFRDNNPGPTSNTSDGLSVTFCN